MVVKCSVWITKRRRIVNAVVKKSERGGRACVMATPWAVILTVLTSLALTSGAPQTYGGPVKVNKCCESYEIRTEKSCVRTDIIKTAGYSPLFTDVSGKDNVQVDGFKFIIGVPACENTQQWSIYHYRDSADELAVLSDGKLRHYTHREKYLENLQEMEMRKRIYGRLHEPIPEISQEDADMYYYDYDQGKYCIDKVINDKNETGLFALVCRPEINSNWNDADFVMRKFINPLFHVMCIICYLLVAIIYFILPTLRDLTGNIVTTINMCLILTQVADLVRIFTELGSHVSFMVADTVLYISLLAAFFWLNSMGYYIWRTFKSRNVFLRVTDGRKYCYYMCYAWGCSILLCALALFAHFMLDTGNKNKNGHHSANSFITNGDQETIGWLGIAVFFTPIAFIIIVNIFFYVTTLKIINRMNTYGRIHHKLKHNFVMFLLIFTVMTICWLFFILAWFPYNGLMYAHIFVNALQGPLLLYICVFRQKHVMFLLRKSCCYNEPVPTNDWGDEMTQMNGSSY